MPDDSDAVTTWVRYPQQRAFAAAFGPGAIDHSRIGSAGPREARRGLDASTRPRREMI